MKGLGWRDRRLFGLNAEGATSAKSSSSLSLLVRSTTCGLPFVRVASGDENFFCPEDEGSGFTRGVGWPCAPRTESRSCCSCAGVSAGVGGGIGREKLPLLFRVVCTFGREDEDADRDWCDWLCD